MIDFQKIPVSYGGHDYVAEFDADTLLKCQSAGVLALTDKPIDFAFECFFGASRRIIHTRPERKHGNFSRLSSKMKNMAQMLFPT